MVKNNKPEEVGEAIAKNDLTSRLIGLSRVVLHRVLHLEFKLYFFN